MFKKISLLIFLFSLNCFSQSKFENGYIITNNGEKIKCQINNLDWKYNPTKFEYKLLNSDEVLIGRINNIKEFGIENKEKFKRFTVEIDRSSNITNRLSTSREPNFNSETLYLKIIIDGTIKLYVYNDDNLIRYFTSHNSNIPKQLIYKKYLRPNRQNGGEKVYENNDFQKQLDTLINCKSITYNELQNIKYKLKDLVNILSLNSNCNNTNEINYTNAFEKKGEFNFKIKVGQNSSKMNYSFGDNSFRNVEFDKESSLRYGIEFEYVLPFNNKKWSIIVDPNYQKYETQKEIIYNISVIGNSTTNAKIKYSSIELPIGFRHYMYLNDSSSIFLNVSMVFDFESKNQYLDYETASLQDIEIESGQNFAFGVGYRYKSLNLELRQFTKRKLSNILSIDFDYTTTAFIVGYKLF